MSRFDPVAKLVSIGSGSIGADGGHTELASFLPEASELAPLYANKNGFYAFESAFLVFPITSTGEYPGLMDAGQMPWPESILHYGRPFAVNGISELFTLQDKKICHVDLQASEILTKFNTLKEFSSAILEDYEIHTAYELVTSWQSRYGRLPPATSLVSKTPFILGGDYSIDNLFPMKVLKSIQYNHEIGSQLRGLDDGSQIEMTTSDLPRGHHRDR